ncbi:MAG: oxidoreductase [Nocardioidaceae bacterium]|nr:oxidoreductase [Nocardioidaceae bacterium]
MNPLKGIVAAAAAIAVTELLSGLFAYRRSPVVGIGEAVIDATPGGIAHAIIEVVGKADKPLAVTSVVVVILAFGALLGAFWNSRRVLAIAGVVAFTVAGMLINANLADSSSGQVVICAFGGVTALVVLHLLNPSAPREHVQGRRAMLRNTGLVLVGSVVLAGVGRKLGQARAGVETARKKLVLPLTKMTAPAGADLGLAQPWNTPVGDFYRIDTSLTPPLIPPDEWSLKIHGMVDREMTITYQQLIDRGLKDAWVTLCCVSNGVGGDLIGNGIWSGVPMKDLLEEVGIQAGADALLSTSQDGWTCGTPLDVLLDGRDALLAVAQDGQPLTVEHGFPVRQVVPGLYGYVSATKWVVDWEITRFADFHAYWTDRGWSEKGPVKTQSRIDVPRGKVAKGAVKVAGVAWAQHRGIEKVEVRFDQTTWQVATLAAVPSADTWVQWVVDWDAEPGDHVIEVRATDKDGMTQSGKKVGTIPNGAEGWDFRIVTVTG